MPCNPALTDGSFNHRPSRGLVAMARTANLNLVRIKAQPTTLILRVIYTMLRFFCPCLTACSQTRPSFEPEELNCFSFSWEPHRVYDKIKCRMTLGATITMTDELFCPHPRRENTNCPFPPQKDREDPALSPSFSSQAHSGGKNLIRTSVKVKVPFPLVSCKSSFCLH